MKRVICSYVILVAGMFAGSTHAEKSLWGDIDSPDVPSKAVQVQAAQITPVAAATPSKTTCDVLAAAPRLDPTVLKSAAMQETLRNNAQFVPAQYKSLITTADAMNSLYALYRKQYIYTYCR